MGIEELIDLELFIEISNQLTFFSVRERLRLLILDLPSKAQI
jgi:hypothetical protein